MYYALNKQTNDRHLAGKIIIFLAASLIFLGFWAYIMLMSNPSPPQIQYYYVGGSK